MLTGIILQSLLWGSNRKTTVYISPMWIFNPYHEWLIGSDVPDTLNMGLQSLPWGANGIKPRRALLWVLQSLPWGADLIDKTYTSRDRLQSLLWGLIEIPTRKSHKKALQSLLWGTNCSMMVWCLTSVFFNPYYEGIIRTDIRYTVRGDLQSLLWWSNKNQDNIFKQALLQSLLWVSNPE